jgi:hypothetical protein
VVLIDTLNQFLVFPWETTSLFCRVIAATSFGWCHLGPLLVRVTTVTSWLVPPYSHKVGMTHISTCLHGVYGSGDQGYTKLISSVTLVTTIFFLKNLLSMSPLAITKHRPWAASIDYMFLSPHSPNMGEAILKSFIQISVSYNTILLDGFISQ